MPVLPLRGGQQHRPVQPVAPLDADQIDGCLSSSLVPWLNELGGAERLAHVPVLMTYLTDVPARWWALGLSAALHGIPLVIVGRGMRWALEVTKPTLAQRARQREHAQTVHGAQNVIPYATHAAGEATCRLARLTAPTRGGTPSRCHLCRWHRHSDRTRREQRDGWSVAAARCDVTASGGLLRRVSELAALLSAGAAGCSMTQLAANFGRLRAAPACDRRAAQQWD